MAVGLATKYCYHCQKDTVQKAEIYHELLVWICLDPDHITHRVAEQEAQNDTFCL